MKTLTWLPFVLMLGLSGCYVVVEDVFDPADRFIGSYEVDEWSESLGIQTYFDIYIYRDRFEGDVIYIENFYNTGMEIYAEVHGSRVRIPRQQIGYFEVMGSGSLFNHELTLDYSVRDIYDPTGFTDYCNAICFRY